MAVSRSLPTKRNPLLAPKDTHSHNQLTHDRRLGQMQLTVDAEHVGTSNATKREHLGLFDYAHLRAPLPESLKGSEIFSPAKLKHPGFYYLMRRSSDGFISASGMFKVTFPWAKTAEEDAEWEYLKSLKHTARDEVAGNLWVSESFALDLAEEYGIRPWIVALLDPAPISNDSKKNIASPARFHLPTSKATTLPAPITTATPGRGRGRPRAASPTKGSPTKLAASATPGKPASPRKRPVKAAKETGIAAARQASESLKNILDSATSVADSETPNEGNSTSTAATAPGTVKKERKTTKSKEKEKDKDKDKAGDKEKVKVTVKEEVVVNGDTETTHTAVSVAMPAGSPELPLPQSTEEMIATAREMVAEAKRADGEGQGRSSARKGGKRKAEVMTVDDDDEINNDSKAGNGPHKRVRITEEEEVRKQRVRVRALVGVAATLAVGAVIPYIL